MLSEDGLPCGRHHHSIEAQTGAMGEQLTPFSRRADKGRIDVVEASHAVSIAWCRKRRGDCEGVAQRQYNAGLQLFPPECCDARPAPRSLMRAARCDIVPRPSPP